MDDNLPKIQSSSTPFWILLESLYVVIQAGETPKSLKIINNLRGLPPMRVADMDEPYPPWLPLVFTGIGFMFFEASASCLIPP